MSLVVVDASVVIALLNAEDSHHLVAAAWMRQRGDARLVLPASAYAEVLVRPLQVGAKAEARLVAAVDDLFDDVIPIDRSIAHEAARLRSSPNGPKLPDALVLATASVLAADELITTDTRWKKYGAAVTVLGARSTRRVRRT